VTTRECRAFTRLVNETCAPRSPLPPVEETDAAAAFDLWLRRAPRLNRVALRLALVTLGARLEMLRGMAAFSYYGDPRVAQIVGYAPRAR
jgi:hypothetical protein